jgi:hypothetical protein
MMEMVQDAVVGIAGAGCGRRDRKNEVVVAVAWQTFLDNGIGGQAVSLL